MKNQQASVSRTKPIPGATTQTQSGKIIFKQMLLKKAKILKKNIPNEWIENYFRKHTNIASRIFKPITTIRNTITHKIPQTH